jgi:hypothetical protein
LPASSASLTNTLVTWSTCHPPALCTAATQLHVACELCAADEHTSDLHAPTSFHSSK